MGKVKSTVATWFEHLRTAAVEFRDDRANRLGAGLAYYSLFAFLPTVFLAVAIAGAFVGREAAEGRLGERLDETLGEENAQAIEDAVAAVWETNNTTSFALISLAVILYSASVLFVAWRDNLEAIWDVPVVPSLGRSLRRRLFGLAVPVGAGLALAAIMIVELIMGAIVQLVNLELLDATARVAGSLIPAAGSVLALGLFYRYSTRSRRPDWADVWAGTIVASIALAVMSWGYGVYIRIVGAGSVAGVASAVFVGLVLFYYGAQILLYGAELIKVAGEGERDIDSSAGVSEDQ